MTEEKINDAGVFIEPYGGGFIIADYSDLARFAGVSLSWRTQPIVSDPFPSRDDALKAASEHVGECRDATTKPSV